MFEPDEIKIDIVVDKPKSGMWHNGPNRAWVTVTHLATKNSVRVYGRNLHSTREKALLHLQMIVEDCRFEDCIFPDLAP